mmetsp:Transcript_45501/g.114584  ORF Transcript_45501/g.114584 Transcript_45501/m.114584 type:complete len:232 (-) Transcript_45501:818-1513(-)
MLPRPAGKSRGTGTFCARPRRSRPSPRRSSGRSGSWPPRRRRRRPPARCSRRWPRSRRRRAASTSCGAAWQRWRPSSLIACSRRPPWCASGCRSRRASPLPRSETSFRIQRTRSTAWTALATGTGSPGPTAGSRPRPRRRGRDRRGSSAAAPRAWTRARSASGRSIASSLSPWRSSWTPKASKAPAWCCASRACRCARMCCTSGARSSSTAASSMRVSPSPCPTSRKRTPG